MKSVINRFVILLTPFLDQIVHDFKHIFVNLRLCHSCKALLQPLVSRQHLKDKSWVILCNFLLSTNSWKDQKEQCVSPSYFRLPYLLCGSQLQARWFLQRYKSLKTGHKYIVDILKKAKSFPKTAGHCSFTKHYTFVGDYFQLWMYTH